MVLGITEDFSLQVDLDSELTTIPKNGIYINSGVNPMITMSNLLSFLPIKGYDFEAYDNAKEYLPFKESRNIKKSIVEDNGTLYQCIKTSTGNTVTDTEFWLETNIESLRLKSFLYTVLDRVKADLALENRLIDNQYLYEIGKFKHLPEGDYFGWAIEPKNSDYVKLTLNELSIQNDISGLVNVYVVNQGELIDTLQVEGGDGKVKFERTDYDFYGKGTFYFLIEKEEIYRKNKYVDWQRYEGFVAYPVTAIGTSWDALDINPTGSANGVGLNISATLESNVYLENCLKNIAYYVRSTFEYMAFQLFAQNSNTRLNATVRDQRDQVDAKIVLAELKDNSSDTESVVKRYLKQRKEALLVIQKTFDAHLHKDNDGITVTVSSV